MDAALVLKIKYSNGEVADYHQALPYLEGSALVKELLADFDFDILSLLNRLNEITEIPFASRLPKVQEWLSNLAGLSFCGDGFSITGKRDDLLSCYNAMTTSVLIRMEYPDREKILAGIQWILKYQNVERGKENIWPGSRALKYGGCLKATPCYIGLVKSMIALSNFKRSSFYTYNGILEEKLRKGLGYILEHRLYKRQSNGAPITSDIEKITFPFSYKTNIIELLRLMKDNNLLADNRCNEAKSLLISKKHKLGHWRINSSYLPKCWITFDKTREPGLWVSHEIEKVLK